MNPETYNLVARNKVSNDVTILMNVKNLQIIDDFTTNFSSEEELISFLIQNNVINFSEVDLYIVHSFTNNIEHLDVLFKDLESIINISYNGVINYQNDLFIQAVDNYFLEFNNSNVRNYILNSNDINLKLKQDIDTMYKAKTIGDYNYFKSIVIKDFTNYNIFRKMISTIRNYHNPDIKRMNDIKNNERNNIKNATVSNINILDLIQDQIQK